MKMSQEGDRTDPVLSPSCAHTMPMRGALECGELGKTRKGPSTRTYVRPHPSADGYGKNHEGTVVPLHCRQRPGEEILEGTLLPSWHGCFVCFGWEWRKHNCGMAEPTVVSQPLLLTWKQSLRQSPLRQPPCPPWRLEPVCLFLSGRYKNEKSR